MNSGVTGVITWYKKNKSFLGKLIRNCLEKKVHKDTGISVF